MKAKHRHRWVSVGGCRENPGMYGIGGAAIEWTQECATCRAVRKKIFGDVNACGNRNHGWRIIDEEVRSEESL